MSLKAKDKAPGWGKMWDKTVPWAQACDLRCRRALPRECCCTPEVTGCGSVTGEVDGGQHFNFLYSITTFSDLVPNLVITTVVSTEPHVSCCKWYSSYKRALQNASASVLANEFLKCMHLTNTVVSIHINVNCSSCWAPISIFWQNVSLKYIGEVNVIW